MITDLRTEVRSIGLMDRQREAGWDTAPPRPDAVSAVGAPLSTSRDKDSAAEQIDDVTDGAACYRTRSSSTVI